MEPTASSNMEPSPGSSSSSSSSNENNSSTSSPLLSTSMVGAPTSVVVTFSHSSSNMNPSSSHVNQPSPPIPSTSGTSLSQYPTITSPAISPETPSSSQIHFVSENFVQPMIVSQTTATQSTLIQLSSGSGSNSSGSQSTIESQQQASDLLKRSFELIRVLDPSKSCAENCKRSKTSSLSISSIPKTWDDGLTMRQKLEQRLNGILCCAVCLDLPKSSIYQPNSKCPNGHLMCAGCFTHVLADARLRDELPTCPSCRVLISKESCSRNLAVEKAVCELPDECRFCQRELPRSMLEKHMTEVCEERIVPCRFSNIGCPWNGPFHEADYHANNCSHPNKSAREVLDYLEEEERKKCEQRKVHETLFTLLSYEKISFHDVQFRPYRTDEYIHKLFYETSRFTAFNLQWVIKARVNDDQRDPTQSCDRNLSFQLCLKSKINNTMTINYMLLKGPFGETKVLPMIYKFDFTESQTESTYNFINLATAADSNRLLSARMINFRLIMFQASK